MNENNEFDYARTDDQLVACGSLPILDRLQWRDDVRRFTPMVRDAPTVDLEGRRWQDTGH